ncbi:MAG: sensor histidine kinase [Alphaproteobacteria bacterium]|nr:MAG: sensor histidine kinase [Alphaproteobacteria bacterium]
MTPHWLVSRLDSVGGRLLTLVSGLSVLLFTASLVLVVYAFHQSRQELDARLSMMAEGLSRSTDGQLKQALSVVTVLSDDPDLAAQDWSRFHRRSVTLDKVVPGWILVRDGEGRLLSDSRAPDAAVASGRQQTKGRPVLERGPIKVAGVRDGRDGPTIEVSAPFVAAGRSYSLVYVLPAEAMAFALREQTLAQGAVGSVLDRDLRLVARTRDGARFAGVLAPPELRMLVETQPSGRTAGVSLNGQNSIGAFRRSPETGWTVVVTVTRASSGVATLKAVCAAMAYSLLLILAVGLTVTLSRKIGRQMETLVDHAAALREGRPIQAPPGELAEVRKVREAIADASEDLAAREKRHVLMVNELNHRVKNSLATVQSLARQSFRHHDPARLEVFEGRLLALSRSLDLITRTSWNSANLTDIVTAALEPQLKRIQVHGDAVELRGQAPVSLSMVLHELMTNSAKYGALSDPAGKIMLSWVTDGANLQIEWREVGGPLITPPAGTGFGSRLMRTLVEGELRGEFHMHFPSQGFEAKLTVPLEVERRWKTSF